MCVMVKTDKTLYTPRQTVMSSYAFVCDFVYKCVFVCVCICDCVYVCVCLCEGIKE